jgi:hypothetical protein
MASPPERIVNLDDFRGRPLATEGEDSHDLAMDEPKISGGTAGSTTAEIDAKIAVAEARTDTKFAELLGEIKTGFAEAKGRGDALSARFDHIAIELTEAKADAKSHHRTQMTLILAAVAVVAAFLAYGAQWFGLGINATDVATHAADRALRDFVAKLPLNPPH